MRRVSAANREGGATAVMVAILMVPLFGFGALVVDVGALVQERRELQNGADAAALAVAKDCAGGNCGGFDNTAETFADANALDGDSNVDPGEVCGFGPGLPACSSPPSVPAGVSGYAMVTARTREVSSGTNQITFTLARVLGFTGAPVNMRSVAGWGPVGAAKVIPLTFSRNEFDCLLPGGVASLPSATKTIYFHTSNQATRPDCTPGPVSGLDNPGGFGWLDTDGTNQCAANVSAQQKTYGSTGNTPPTPVSATGCTSAFFASLIGTTVLIPIYSSVTGSGAKNGYFIEGFAGFLVTGYKFGGGPADTSSPPPCTGSFRCIRGRFVAHYAFGAQPGAGATNFGSTTVSVIG